MGGGFTSLTSSARWIAADFGDEDCAFIGFQVCRQGLEGGFDVVCVALAVEFLVFFEFEGVLVDFVDEVCGRTVEVVHSAEIRSAEGLETFGFGEVGALDELAL